MPLIDEQLLTHSLSTHDALCVCLWSLILPDFHAWPLLLSWRADACWCHQYFCYEALYSHRENAEAEALSCCVSWTFINTIHESAAVVQWDTDTVHHHSPSLLMLTCEPLYFSVCMFATVLITVGCMFCNLSLYGWKWKVLLHWITSSVMSSDVLLVIESHTCWSETHWPTNTVQQLRHMTDDGTRSLSALRFRCFWIEVSWYSKSQKNT